MPEIADEPQRSYGEDQRQEAAENNETTTSSIKSSAKYPHKLSSWVERQRKKN